MTSQAQLLARRDIHLLVVDDDDRIRELLKRYLTRQGYRVSAAADAALARRLMDTLTFDCLILDVMMPGETGFELTKSLREHNDVPIILLTARGEAADRINGLKYGADDYLAKPFEPEELTLRVDAVLRRLSAKPSETTTISFGPFIFDRERQSLTKDGTVLRLTTAELALMSTLAQRPGVAVARHALAENIGAKSERAVDVQMTRLRRKIEHSPAEPNYLITVRGKGYLLRSDGV